MNTGIRIVAVLLCLLSFGLVVAYGVPPVQSNPTVFTTIDFPGARTTAAEGINRSQTIVGFYADSANAIHAFTLSNGNYQSLDAPSGMSTAAYGGNDAGTIVGTYINFSQHGFSDLNGVFRTMDFGSVLTSTNGINRVGWTVGFYSNS